MDPIPPIEQPLLDALRRMPRQLFAVVDGAFFDSFTAELKPYRLASRPLFLEPDDDAGVDAGPHLVMLPNLHAFERLQAFVADKAACVFWSWPHDPEALYHHLRTINLVEVPGYHAESNLRYETVMLRNADPHVMAALVPTLEPEKLSRLLGAAQGLVMDARDLGGVRILFRPEGLPAPPRGFLRLEDRHMDALIAGQVERSRRKIMQFLRDEAPEETAHLDDAALYRICVQSEQRGEQLGLESEQALMKFAFLAVYTRLESLRSKEVERAITRGRHPPEEAISILLEEMVD